MSRQLWQSRKLRLWQLRSGISMIELLVVLAVISLLLALLFPAVQITRETARGIQCRSHLRQLGIAFQSYHSDYGVFPVELQPFVSLLPYVEQSALHKVIEDFTNSSGASANPVFGVVVYICPSDTRANASLGHTSYLINEGYGYQTFGENGMRLPRTYPIPYTRDRDITDGLSNTACLSERLVAFRNSTPAEIGTQPGRFSWFIATPRLGANQHDAFAKECLTQRTTALTGILYPFERLTTEHGYDHLLPPNSVGCLNATPMSSYHSLPTSTDPATSMHRGGVYVLYADGSVRFVSNVIDVAVWQGIGTRAGSETN